MMKKSRKGFFFVLVVFLIVSYIFVSVQHVSYSKEIAEERFSEKLRVLSLEIVGEQLSQEWVEKAVSVIGYHALYKITEHAVENPIRAGDDVSDVSQNVSNVFFLVFTSGNAPSEYFERYDGGDGDALQYSSEEMENTFWYYRDMLNDSLKSSGMMLKKFEITDFVFNQTDYKTVNVSFNISIEVSDYENEISFVKEYNISKEFSIEGLTDPAIEREELLNDRTVEKQFWFYGDISSIQWITRIDNDLDIGESWFYGEVVDAEDVGSSTSKTNLSILGGTLSEIMSVEDEYGAYAVVGGDAEVSLDKPYVIVTSVPEGFLLFLNASTEIEMYNIENFRGLLACGFYVNSENGPSFFQRLTREWYNKKGNEFGIETFVVGRWAGGEDDEAREEYSRLDWEFYNETMGIRVKGMPGCKTPDMCEEHSPVGHFRVSEETANRYGIEELLCNRFEEGRCW